MSECKCLNRTESIDHRSELAGLLECARNVVDTTSYQTYRRPNHPDPARRGTLVQVLVQIIISQRATLRNEIRAADALFERHGTLEQLAKVSVDELAALIKPAGLQVAKSKNISTVCKYIVSNFGVEFEESMASMEDSAARTLLLSLPGVGPKTADCLLELGLGRLVLPVETNIRQVGRRLRWITEEQSDQTLQEIISAQIKPSNEEYIETHSLLMAVGQRLCKGRVPQCSTCIACNYLKGI
jgi:endonuclease-3